MSDKNDMRNETHLEIPPVGSEYFSSGKIEKKVEAGRKRRPTPKQTSDQHATTEQSRATKDKATKATKAAASNKTRCKKSSNRNRDATNSCNATWNATSVSENRQTREKIKNTRPKQQKQLEQQDVPEETRERIATSRTKKHAAHRGDMTRDTSCPNPVFLTARRKRKRDGDGREGEKGRRWN
jgi:hypothetical protein